jgi:hypothetical protein
MKQRYPEPTVGALVLDRKGRPRKKTKARIY